MTTYQAPCIPGVGEPATVESYELPAVPADGILIKVELGGVCATDLHLGLGHIPGIAFPLNPGHETCGIVTEVGADFGTDVLGRELTVGSRVAVMPATPCGHCRHCLQRSPYPDCANWDVVGFSNPTTRPHAGGWGQYLLLHSGARLFVTEGSPEAAVLAEPAATPAEGLLRAGLRFGDSVLVQGSGTVGLLAIAIAAAAGASRISVIGGPARRLELATTLGASATFDIATSGSAADRRQAVLASSPDGVGFDVVVECAGAPAAFAEGLGYLRRGGVYVELGHFSDVGTVPINPYLDILSRDVRLVSSSGYTADSFRRALGVTEGLGDLASRIITHRLPMDRGQDAMDALRQGWQLDGEQVGKIVIDPWL
ncbi:MAG: alcohol dehydrogenase catalytic domain-containing protein [Actinobacteria bacterium]|nr:alcohol dehydrogenase catalytic domain-containing protein [Actinomycetota bacterium]